MSTERGAIMLEQFVKSIFAYFQKVDPMNAYVQSIPEGVQYPCYLLNKCDIRTEALNSYYFMNNIHLYIRCFGEDEVDLKNRINNVTNTIFAEHRKIPILNEDGTPTERFVRIENIESINLPVDENEIYCVEINFSFDTTHIVNQNEFQLLDKVYLGTTTVQ
jgi:hypothetical protein